MVILMNSYSYGHCLINYHSVSCAKVVHGLISAITPSAVAGGLDIKGAPPAALGLVILGRDGSAS